MKKKKLAGVIFIVILLGIFAYVGFVPRIYRQQVEVPYSLMKIYEQITLPANIAKWYYPFSSAGVTGATYEDTSLLRISSGEYTLQLNPTSTAGASYTTTKNNKQGNFLFTVVADTTDTESKVVLTYKSTLLGKLLGKNELENNARKSLEALKTRMEDTKVFYGFEIRAEKVIDTSFLFKTTIVKSSLKAEGMKALFDELLVFAEKNNAGHNGVKIFYSQQRANDLVELYAGIGVTNKIITQPTDPIQYKMMPVGKNLLSAFYQGPYGKVNDAYQALQEFKSDHRLVSMAIPFERFMGSEYSFTDSQTVQLKVYYPIF